MTEAVTTPKTPALYPLDQNEFEIAISIKLAEDRSKQLHHKVRRPTMAELLERESQSVTEMEEVAPGEDAFHTEMDGANSRLYDKIAIQIKGYKAAGVNPAEWTTPTPEMLAKIPTAHKSTVVSGLYLSKCDVEADNEDGFDLDGGSYVVKQEIGAGDEPDYVIRHTLRAPTETERRDYDKAAGKASQVFGSRKRKIRFRTNLKAEVALYDKLFISLDGATPANPESVDPIFKRQAVQALLTSLNASLSD